MTTSSIICLASTAHTSTSTNQTPRPPPRRTLTRIDIVPPHSRRNRRRGHPPAVRSVRAFANPESRPQRSSSSSNGVRLLTSAVATSSSRARRCCGTCVGRSTPSPIARTCGSSRPRHPAVRPLNRLDRRHLTKVRATVPEHRRGLFRRLRQPRPPATQRRSSPRSRIETLKGVAHCGAPLSECREFVRLSTLPHRPSSRRRAAACFMPPHRHRDNAYTEVGQSTGRSGWPRRVADPASIRHVFLIHARFLFFLFLMHARGGWCLLLAVYAPFTRPLRSVCARVRSVCAPYTLHVRSVCAFVYIRVRSVYIRVRSVYIRVSCGVHQGYL